jgi:hypothetical protein
MMRRYQPTAEFPTGFSRRTCFKKPEGHGLSWSGEGHFSDFFNSESGAAQELCSWSTEVIGLQLSTSSA